MSVFVVRANTSFGTLYIELSSAACFGSFGSSSGRFCDVQDGQKRLKHVDDVWI
jgi:hypothetical protein